MGTPIAARRSSSDSALTSSRAMFASNSVRTEADGLADRAAPAGEGDLGDAIALDPDVDADLVAADRAGVLVAVVGRLEDAPIPRVPGVVEDLSLVDAPAHAPASACTTGVMASPAAAGQWLAKDRGPWKMRSATQRAATRRSTSASVL